MTCWCAVRELHIVGPDCGTVPGTTRVSLGLAAMAVVGELAALGIDHLSVDDCFRIAAAAIEAAPIEQA